MIEQRHFLLLGRLDNRDGVIAAETDEQRYVAGPYHLQAQKFLIEFAGFFQVAGFQRPVRQEIQLQGGLQLVGGDVVGHFDLPEYSHPSFDGSITDSLSRENSRVNSKGYVDRSAIEHCRGAALGRQLRAWTASISPWYMKTTILAPWIDLY